VFASFDIHDFFTHQLSALGLSIDDMLLPQSPEYVSYRFRIRFHDAFQKALRDANGHQRTLTFSFSASAQLFKDFLEFNGFDDIVNGGPAVENVRNQTVMGSAHYSQNEGRITRFYPQIGIVICDAPVVSRLCSYLGGSFYFHPFRQSLNIPGGFADCATASFHAVPNPNGTDCDASGTDCDASA
jgi:hypothetical protein